MSDKGKPKTFTIGDADRRVLRRLAGRVAELAAHPVQDKKREMWYRHNALEPTRPVIFCDPEGGWEEIFPEEVRQCTGEIAREWEFALLREVFWGESMGDDRVIEPHFNVRCVAETGDWGIQEHIEDSSEEKGAWRYETVLESYEQDLDRLRFPAITVDHDATERMLALAHETFDGMLSVRLKTNKQWWWSLGMTDDVISLRGLGQYMYDMYDHPDGLHGLMAFLRDAHLAMLDFLKENDLLALNNDGAYVGSGGFGYTHELPQQDFDGEHVRPIDMWGFCESQETVGVSPEFFEEFVFAYQLPIMERFGLNCYGCCEPLDKRWHVVKRAPRLRRVSASAWVNTDDMAEMLGNRYVYSMKPNPSDLAAAKMDQDRVRAELRKALETTRKADCRVEVIMKDTHTIGKNPENVINWCRIAREEAERVGA